MRARAFHHFVRDERAASTVEFVAIMPFFVLIAFFILEISVATFRIATAEKAVQLAARMAAVSDPAATGVPTINARAGSGVYGDQCNTGACSTAWSPKTCTGTGCTAAAFDPIWNRMQNIFNVPKANVTITYSDAGLGFAGGPTIPSVTVTVSGVPYDTIFTAILQNFFTTTGAGASPFVNLPPMSVTMTAEDLTTAGAS